MKAEELANKVWEEFLTYNPSRNEAWTRKIVSDTDFYRETNNIGGICPFYQWLACLVRLQKPKKVVELGADRGGSACYILSELDEFGKLYSCDIREGWELLPDWDSRILRLLGNDLMAFKQFEKEWNNVDLWFVDSNHDSKHVKKEMGLISKLVKPGAVILNHDIYAFGLLPLLKEYPYDLWEDNRKVFGNGIALQVI